MSEFEFRGVLLISLAVIAAPLAHDASDYFAAGDIFCGFYLGIAAAAYIFMLARAQRERR